MTNVFHTIYQQNAWGDDESVSGKGSNLAATEAIRKALPELFEQYCIMSVLDIPCGDYHWFSQMPHNLFYIGADIVPELVKQNEARYQDLDHMFIVRDIVTDTLPGVDLVLVRDLFGHLPNYKIKQALRNIHKSGSEYLLATTFPERHDTTLDVEEGAWRPVNLEQYWGLGKALKLINERCTVSGYEDKSLGLWRLR